MLETRDFIFSLVLQFLHAHNPKVTLLNNFRKLRLDLDPAHEVRGGISTGGIVLVLREWGIFVHSKFWTLV